MAENVELLISELREPVSIRDAERVFNLMNLVLSRLEPTRMVARNTPAPDDRTVGAWKRLAQADANHPSEIQSLPYVIRHLTRDPLPSPGGNHARIQFLARNGTLPPCNIARFYFPTSGHQRPRLAHHTARAFDGAAGGDILVLLPLRTMNNCTALTLRLDFLEETDADCLAVVLSPSSEQGARVSALIGNSNTAQGYFSIPHSVG